MPKVVRNALTVKQVQNLRAPGAYNDGGGLHLVVQASGSKQWHLRTTVEGRRRKFGVGGYPAVQLAEARDRADAMRRQIRDGVDPGKKAQNASRAPSFREMAEAHHASNIVTTSKNGKHVAQWINTLSTYAFPKIGDMPVDQIRSRDVVTVLEPIWLAKSETARRVRQRIHAVLEAGFVRFDIDRRNPVDGVHRALPKQPEGVSRHHPAMPWVDTPAFVSELLQERRRGEVARLCLAFLIATATRSGEARGARWDEIDLESRVWTIPAERMKAGREHVVPLNELAMHVLELARPLAGRSELVFPGQRRVAAMSDMTLLQIMRRANQPYTPHGFRSTFRDWAAECSDAPREVAELCLAHSVGNAVERAYARSTLLDKRRELMNAWGVHCLG
ncbi:integrase arm-type DNA-binding domain-containing protein [bacterium]|nr:integrase arm-type DNA-binding domain-containing protein [bacterium]